MAARRSNVRASFCHGPIPVLDAGYLESAREGYLRASTYFPMAEFYLHGNPGDPRIFSDSRASQKAYAEGASSPVRPGSRLQIPYQGSTLPGYFYKADIPGKPRPTLIFHGGMDSSLEELFYFGAAHAIRRGYNCLTFDGPGQGAPIREQQLCHRYHWEAVVTPAVNYALSRHDVDGDYLALMGMSLGGYFAARMYDALRAPKQFVRFTSEDAAENHCESGALAYKDEVVFNWLDETLRIDNRGRGQTGAPWFRSTNV